MTGRGKAAGLLGALAVAATTAAVTLQFNDTPRPHAVGLAAKSFTIAPNCQVSPGKYWGGMWHFSPAILKPTVIQTACWTQRRPPLGTLVKVSLAPVPATTVPDLAAP